MMHKIGLGFVKNTYIQVLTLVSTMNSIAIGLESE